MFIGSTVVIILILFTALGFTVIIESDIFHNNFIYSKIISFVMLMLIMWAIIAYNQGEWIAKETQKQVLIIDDGAYITYNHESYNMNKYFNRNFTGGEIILVTESNDMESMGIVFTSNELNFSVYEPVDNK